VVFSLFNEEFEGVELADQHSHQVGVIDCHELTLVSLVFQLFDHLQFILNFSPQVGDFLLKVVDLLPPFLLKARVLLILQLDLPLLFSRTDSRDKLAIVQVEPSSQSFILPDLMFDLKKRVVDSSVEDKEASKCSVEGLLMWCVSVVMTHCSSFQMCFRLIMLTYLVSMRFFLSSKIKNFLHNVIIEHFS